MNKISFKLFIWKHPSILVMTFLIPVFIQPLLVIPYFFIALLHFIVFDKFGIRIIQALKKANK